MPPRESVPRSPPVISTAAPPSHSCFGSIAGAMDDRSGRDCWRATAYPIIGGTAIASQHARPLRLTNGPYGEAPALIGRHCQYNSFGDVARWTTTRIVRPRPSHEIPRIVIRTPLRPKV